MYFGRSSVGGTSKQSVRVRDVAACSATGILLLACGPVSKAQVLENAPSAMLLRSLEQGAQQSTQVRTAAIYGEVLDVNQGIVPGAKVILQTPRELSDPSLPPEREVLSDSEGRFRFSDLPAGKYTFTISSAGLETFVSLEITLRDGQQHEAPKIALPIASTTSDVTVKVTQRELADEQIKAEMGQRVLGILPNFYSSYVWDAAPLETKQKFKMAVRSRSDPFVFVATGIVAGIQQARNTHKEFGQGAEGYAKRYGATFATGTLSRFLGSAVYPSLFHQDPRYFYKGSGSFGNRSWYAMTRSVVARGDNGKWQPNYSHILGGMTAGAISNLYYSEKERGARLTFENAALGIGFTALANLVREFGLRRITHGVPSFNNGQKAITDK
ncbi:MAG: carboxypeptidase-like regulatory domain-containing protein [Janthinobacterium lividum]